MVILKPHLTKLVLLRFTLYPQYNRLPVEVASAPAIFQRTMETLMRTVKGTSVYIDDILVTGSSVQEHLQNLDTVLDR